MKQKNNLYCIYKAVNKITNQVYIGATTHSICRRKEDHIKKTNVGNENKFHNAIATYGIDAFNWETIDTANSSDELAQKEKFYILKYNTRESGYNSDAGGGFKKTVYQYDVVTGKLINSFANLSEAAKKVNSSKQHISRACLSVNQRYRGYIWSYQYQEPYRPEKDARVKQVMQLSQDNRPVASYVSVAEASRQTGLSKTCISRVCRGERAISGGYLWRYREE